MTDLNLFTIPSTNHHDNMTLSHAGITNPVDPANHSSESYVKPSNPQDMNFLFDHLRKIIFADTTSPQTIMPIVPPL